MPDEAPTVEKTVGGPVKRPLVERLFARISITPSCWLWTGSVVRGGYGTITIGIGKKQRVVHRIVYELFVGPIPEGLQLDHLCRNRACVNPDHLEPVTLKENVLRGRGITAERARQTHCKRGHPLSGENLLLAPGQRICRTCRSVNQKRYRESRKLQNGR